MMEAYLLPLCTSLWFFCMIYQLEAFFLQAAYLPGNLCYIDCQSRGVQRVLVLNYRLDKNYKLQLGLVYCRISCSVGCNPCYYRYQSSQVPWHTLCSNACYFAQKGVPSLRPTFQLPHSYIQELI